MANKGLKSKNGINTLNSKNNGKMIMISDLEGCAEYSMSGAKQSTISCKKPFFEKLGNFLENNPKNKVAFLGDYFDKGPLASDSINNIITLYEKFEGRVIIILGNRDINKLRFGYEIQNLELNDNPQYRWSVWENFYNNYKNLKPNDTNNIILEKIKIILIESMGAAPALSKNNQRNKSIVAYEYFKDMFELNNKSFKFQNNIINLFQYGKIVHYDEDYKVLLSHAGGVDPELLKININEFIKDLNELLNNNESLDYYQKIELIRKNLHSNINSIKLLKNNNTNKNQLNNLIDNTNNILTRFIEKTDKLTKFDIENIPNEHFILQAMGLKSDNTDSKFLSFIDSCDNTGCGGPSTNIDNEYLKILYKNNIRIISHGHKPHCAPVPLTYCKKLILNNNKKQNIIFIDNDVSNGYRPENINHSTKVPLSYIEKNNDKYFVGVGFLYNNIIFSYNEIINKSRVSESLKNFSFMIDKWNIDSEIYPYIKASENKNKNGNNKNSVKYPEGSLCFNKGFSPATPCTNINKK